MSCFTITCPDRERLPNCKKKVWKHLVYAVRSKLRLVDRKPKVLKDTNQRNLSIYSSQRSNYHHHYHHHYHHYHYTYQDQQHVGKCNNINSCGICMEDVFYSAKMHQVGANSSEGGRVVVNHKLEGHDHHEENGHGDGFTTSSSSSTTMVQLNGVDAEAEKFIDSFYQKLSLERQKSTEEFFAMLNRGS